MEEMISYMFGNLKDYEKFMARVNRTLKKQAKTNRLVIVAALGLAGYTYWQNQRIDRLATQLEELKHPEGE